MCREPMRPNHLMKFMTRLVDIQINFPTETCANYNSFHNSLAYHSFQVSSQNPASSVPLSWTNKLSCARTCAHDKRALWQLVLDVLVKRGRRKEMFYLTSDSIHFIYRYVASDIWERTIQVGREKTYFRHCVNWSFRLVTICTIPQRGQPLSMQSWSTGWNEK